MTSFANFKGGEPKQQKYRIVSLGTVSDFKPIISKSSASPQRSVAVLTEEQKICFGFFDWYLEAVICKRFF